MDMHRSCSVLKKDYPKYYQLLNMIKRLYMHIYILTNSHGGSFKPKALCA